MRLHPKIAYVDCKVVFSRAPGRQAAEDPFNKEMEASRTQVQKMGDSLQTMIADYQKAQATLAANVARAARGGDSQEAGRLSDARRRSSISRCSSARWSS